MRKHCKKNATKMRKNTPKKIKTCKFHVVFALFLHFLEGVLSGLRTFQKLQKTQVKCKKKCKKNAKKSKKMQKKMRQTCKLNLFVFLHFLEGVLSGLKIFQKLPKTQVKCKKNASKMRKKCKKHAKEMQILEMCMLYKNKFPEAALFLHFCLHFCLHFPGPRFLGLHFLVAFYLHVFAF